MKTKIQLIVLFIFACLFLIMQPFAVFAELIEPTRTLREHKKPNGRLSVFSEPPGLDVLLDGVEFGRTPVISKEVTSGVHILRVKDTEKEITIVSGKPLQLSLFKGSLIEIPEKKADAPTQPKLEENMATEEKKAQDSNKNKKQYEPFYWPLNPGGPIK